MSKTVQSPKQPPDRPIKIYPHSTFSALYHEAQSIEAPAGHIALQAHDAQDAEARLADAASLFSG
jgi:hypothetical protein